MGIPAIGRNAAWLARLAPALSAGLVLLIHAPQLRAQTGSVSGTVVDTQGEPVSDVMVTIPDRHAGARTDARGQYVIERIPVGPWLLRARVIGKKVAQRTTNVDAGRRTVENFRLEDDPYKVPVVIVIANKATAIRHDTATKTHVSREEVAHLPFTDLKEIIKLKAGVVDYKGELHFHFGRADEILTLVNGIPSRNPLVSEGVDLGSMTIASSEQILGGMDAQYGNALSGVIALTTREGEDTFGGEARYFTDRYGEQDKSFTDFERLSVGFGGPFLFPSTNYYVALQGTYSDTYLRSTAEHREHRFLDFIRLGNRQSNATNVSGKITWRAGSGKKLGVELLRNSSLTGRFHNRWNRKGFVQVLPESAAPTDGSITRRYGTWAYYAVDSTYIPVNTAEHLPMREEHYRQLALTWKHAVDTTTIYNIRASRQVWSSEDDVLDRQLWEYQQEPNQYYDPLNPIDGAYYVTNGDFPFYERRRTVTYTLNGDLTKRIGTHRFMTGGDLNYNDMAYLLSQYPNVLDASGNYGANRDEFRNFNPEGSFFLQDQWKYLGLVLNAGVRYDAFALGSQIPKDAVRSRLKTQWSPRIGIAHPVSDRDVLSFHYGRLFQVPDRIYLYQGRTISSEARGNLDLDPETTISYQLGIQHLFSREIYLQCSVYFKDIFGLVTTVDQEVPGLASTVPTYVNRDYASARGFDVTLIKQYSHGFSGEVNYTYGSAGGTASDPNRSLSSRGNLRDQYKPNAEVPLEWDQRHSMSATLRLGDGSDWAASFVYQFGTGLPYTPELREQRRQDPALINSKRLPATSTLSAQAERSFVAWGQHVTLYMQGTNLLNTRNIGELQPSLWPYNVAVNPSSYVVYYTETGRAGGAFLTADRNGDGIEDWLPVNDPRVFQQGRVIRVGLGVQF
jgi:outer membrane receptor for ferrienterochelin and colicin